MRAAVIRFAAVVVAALVLAEPAASQPQPRPAVAPPAQATGKPMLPSPIAILAMVRSTLIAVDQGNKTGNYTVLRDLATPSFREANDASRLSKIFAMLSKEGIDLLPVTVVEPEYKSPPQVTPKNMLYVYGTFPIAPRPVTFEVLYVMHAGRWRLFGISIEPVKTDAAATSPSPPAQPPQQ